METISYILEDGLENIFKPIFLQIVMCAIIPIVAGSIAIAKLRLCIPSRTLRLASEWAIKIAVVATIAGTLSYTLKNIELPEISYEDILPGASQSTYFEPPEFAEDSSNPFETPVIPEPDNKK